MKTLTMQIARKAQADGNRVFIADDGKGDYGLITTQSGSKCVTFWPAPFGGMNFATCHKCSPGVNMGGGILIAEDRYDMDSINTTVFLDRNVCTDNHRPETLSEHLKNYASSHYKEIK